MSKRSKLKNDKQFNIESMGYEESCRIFGKPVVDRYLQTKSNEPLTNLIVSQVNTTTKTITLRRGR
jgi:hypothetical protein